MTALADATIFLIGSAAMLAAPAYFILQPWAAARLIGRLAEGGAATLLPATPLLLWCSYAFADHSNLWPVPFLLFAPFGTFYLVILLVAARARARGQNER